MPKAETQRWRGTGSWAPVFPCQPHVVRLLSSLGSTLRSDGQKRDPGDFPGSPVVKNPPSNAGDRSLIPGLGTDILHTMEQLKPTCHNYREAFTATKSLHPATKTLHDATKTYLMQPKVNKYIFFKKRERAYPSSTKENGDFFQKDEDYRN